MAINGANREHLKKRKRRMDCIKGIGLGREGRRTGSKMQMTAASEEAFVEDA